MIRFIAIKSIRFYQKNLSHKKGYKCAHGVLHGDTTCSASILNIIKNNSILSWYSLSKKQFESCKNAKITINKKRDKNKKEKSCDSNCTDPYYVCDLCGDFLN